MTTSAIHAPAGTVEARTLDRMVETASDLAGIWEADVHEGDWIVVRTKNSTYSLAALGKGRYRVAGGWFAKSGGDAATVRIVGCTWGGAAIHTRVVAAAGMCIEFDNGVRTTRIREVQLLRDGAETTH